MPDRHGVASFPGIEGVMSCNYTCSHSVTPGTILLRCQTQTKFPDLIGDLVIEDGVGKVTVSDCRLDDIKIEKGDGGEEWVITLSDHRWRWRTGRIAGCYNQLDPHGKLVPWTIKSPKELAVLCLKAMGEDDYQIDLPPGLESAWGQNINNFLGLGVNFPATATNPAVDWQDEVPAVALQRLAEEYGRHVVYDVITKKVLVVKPGSGEPLPEGSIAALSPNMKVPEKPDGVMVVGAPTRFELLFETEAVGEEWDGSYKPIDALSYAPIVAGKKQVSEWHLAFPNNEAAAGTVIFITLVCEGVTQTFSITPAAPISEVDALTDISLLINNSKFPQISQNVEATVAGQVMTLRGRTLGLGFSIDSDGYQTIPGEGYQSHSRLVQAPAKDKADWTYCHPPEYPTVRATKRLTVSQARELAQKSVFRCYQITGRDISKKGPVNVPGYGPIKRKQQILLLDTRVVQVRPEKVDTDYTDKGGKPLVVNYYNGYSRDMPAHAIAATGTSLYRQNISYPAAIGLKDAKEAAKPINTPAGNQIHIGFSIDPVYQLITFNDYVYRHVPNGIEPTEVQLRTACHVRNVQTNELERYKYAEPFGAQTGTNYAVARRDDVQLEVYAVYGFEGAIESVWVESADPLHRAKYYADGLKAQYFLSGAKTIRYNGIEPIKVDGARAQVTWSVGDGGAETVASYNSEHAYWLPAYPTRRRAENLPPAPPPDRAALVNVPRFYY